MCKDVLKVKQKETQRQKTGKEWDRQWEKAR